MPTTFFSALAKFLWDGCEDELNSLKLAVDRVLDAGTRGKITGEDFFQALQAVVAAAASSRFA
jgi:hypothetical protein